LRISASRSRTVRTGNILPGHSMRKSLSRSPDLFDKHCPKPLFREVICRDSSHLRFDANVFPVSCHLQPDSLPRMGSRLVLLKKRFFSGLVSTPPKGPGSSQSRFTSGNKPIAPVPILAFVDARYLRTADSQSEAREEAVAPTTQAENECAKCRYLAGKEGQTNSAPPPVVKPAHERMSCTGTAQ
jgi:hypothetical protein